MKVPLRNYGIRMTQQERQTARAQAADMVRTRGSSRPPGLPRDVFCQAASRGFLVTWKLPEAPSGDIQRWRIYKNDENTLYAEVNDRGTRQCFVESTAGSTPPVTNVFVTSVNSLGVESAKVQAQGVASTEAGAPAIPTVPPGYNNENSGGADKQSNYL